MDRRLIRAALAAWIAIYGLRALVPLYPGVVSVPSVSTLHGFSMAGLYRIHTSGYLTVGDGGEGEWVNVSACTFPNGTTAPVDHGYCESDGGGVLYQRTNLNGDARQYGVVQTSTYDCSPLPTDPTNPGTGVGLGACVDSEPALAAMITAGTALGVSDFTTEGVQAEICTNLILPNYATFSTSAQPENLGGQSPLNVLGTLWTCDHVNVQMGGNNEVHDLIEVPKWFGTTYPQGAATVRDNYIMVQTMASKGDTGLVCAQQNCHVHDSLVAGYDTGYDAQKANNRLERTLFDANVCNYFHNSGSDTHWYNPECLSLLPNSLSSDPACVPGTNPRGNCGIIAVGWNPQQIIEDPAHLGTCQVVIDSFGNDNTNKWNGNGNLVTGFYTWISGPDHTTGGASALGRWKLTRIDATHIDLQGSACTTDVTGGHTYLDGPSQAVVWTVGSPLVTGAASVANIGSEQLVSGAGHASLAGSGIPDGTYVVAVWRTKNIVVLSKPATKSGSGTMLFSTDAFPIAAAPNNCSVALGSAGGTCLILAANERIDAGGSAGGLAAGGTGCATGFLIGGFTNVGDGVCGTGDPAGVKASGFDLYSAFCYGHALCFHFSNFYNGRCISCGMDASRNLHDEDTSFGLVDGNVKSLSFVSGKSGKVGAGLTLNPTGTDKGCLVVTDQNLSIFEVDGGCLISANSTGNGGSFLIGTGLTEVTISGLLNNNNLYCQTNAACAIVDTSGGGLNSGNVIWGGHEKCAGPSPTLTGTGSTGDTMATGGDSCGSFVVNGAGIGNPALTFANVWEHRPAICMGEDQTTGALMLPSAGSMSVSGVTLQLAAGSPSAGDVIGYFCIERVN